MSLDLNRKNLTKNAFRITKRRNYTAIRIRIPGGHLQASHMKGIAEIAETFGDGTLHITARQGFEIPNNWPACLLIRRQELQKQSSGRVTTR